MKEYSFYGYLDEENQELVDKINEHQILGANQQLDIIANMFINIIEMNQSMSVNSILNEVLSLKDYFIKTRGSASRGIVNGINEMLSGVNTTAATSGELLATTIESINQYKENKHEAISKILTYSANEFSDYSSFMLFDYSSTVDKVLINILKRNPSKTINIYISESSAIGGGVPYLSLNDFDNAHVSFFPDAALYNFVQKSDCCLMGAETFYHDGTGFNTVGSEIVGLLCKELNVPLYFLTPMSKLDSRKVEGINKEIIYIEYATKYMGELALTESINTVIPELVGVRPEHTNAFITEYGVIPSQSMFGISTEYLKSIGGY